MPFVTVPDGTRLYYEEVGAGEPLLLISGNGRDHHDWNGVRDDFTDHYRVIVYDHRGTGQSDKPDAPPYSIQGFAHDALRLHMQAAKGHDAYDLLPTIQAPTLVMHGSDDQRLPTANAYLLAGRIPGAELSIIQGGRHGFMVEFREEASRVVNEFLARHPLS